MADDRPLKSAYELALERLRKSDEETGVSSRPLTDQQKAAIAEIRNFYGAKLAEQQVLHESGLRKTFEPSERAAIEQRFRRERERLSSQRDAKIERVRSGEPA
jgi:hypothetical protein